MSIEKIVQRLKDNSKPDTTWIVKARKREIESKMKLKKDKLNTKKENLYNSNK